jgi:hypothetical protein
VVAVSLTVKREMKCNLTMAPNCSNISQIVRYVVSESSQGITVALAYDTYCTSPILSGTCVR